MAFVFLGIALFLLFGFALYGYMTGAWDQPL